MNINQNLPKSTVSHVGICVTNIEKSLRFYCEGLGFVAGAEVSLDNPQTQQLVGIQGEMSGKSQFIKNGPVALELIQFFAPETLGSDTPRPMNQLGFTHLSLRVPDVDAAASRLQALGGSIIAGSRVNFDGGGMVGELVFCMDPDGTRIELMRFPDEVQFY